jgi:hypothetical protein
VRNTKSSPAPEPTQEGDEMIEGRFEEIENAVLARHSVCKVDGKHLDKVAGTDGKEFSLKMYSFTQVTHDVYCNPNAFKTYRHRSQNL